MLWGRKSFRLWENVMFQCSEGDFDNDSHSHSFQSNQKKNQMHAWSYSRSASTSLFDEDEGKYQTTSGKDIDLAQRERNMENVTVPSKIALQREEEISPPQSVSSSNNASYQSVATSQGAQPILHRLVSGGQTTIATITIPKEIFIPTKPSMSITSQLSSITTKMLEDALEERRRDEEVERCAKIRQQERLLSAMKENYLAEKIKKQRQYIISSDIGEQVHPISKNAITPVNIKSQAKKKSAKSRRNYPPNKSIKTTHRKSARDYNKSEDDAQLTKPKKGAVRRIMRTLTGKKRRDGKDMNIETMQNSRLDRIPNKNKGKSRGDRENTSPIIMMSNSGNLGDQRINLRTDSVATRNSKIYNSPRNITGLQDQNIRLRGSLQDRGSRRQANNPRRPNNILGIVTRGSTQTLSSWGTDPVSPLSMQRYMRAKSFNDLSSIERHPNPLENGRQMNEDYKPEFQLPTASPPAWLSYLPVVHDNIHNPVVDTLPSKLPLTQIDSPKGIFITPPKSQIHKNIAYENIAEFDAHKEHRNEVQEHPSSPNSWTLGASTIKTSFDMSNHAPTKNGPKYQGDEVVIGSSKSWNSSKSNHRHNEDNINDVELTPRNYDPYDKSLISVATQSWMEQDDGMKARFTDSFKYEREGSFRSENWR